MVAYSFLGLNRKRACHHRDMINVPACSWFVAQQWIASIVSSPPLQYQLVFPRSTSPSLAGTQHCTQIQFASVGSNYYQDCLGISPTDHSIIELISGECIENINFDKYCIWGSLQETIRIRQAARACLSHRTFFSFPIIPR